MEEITMKEDCENSSDSGLEECGTSPVSAASSQRSFSPTMSDDTDKTRIPSRPQNITQSEGSAFSKIEKLINSVPQPESVPSFKFGAPPSIGYFPGLFVPHWATSNAIEQSSYFSNNTIANYDIEDKRKYENEPNKDAFTEVNTAIPFSNYFQNLTKLLRKSEDSQPEREELQNEPGEITNRSIHENQNRFSSDFSPIERPKSESEFENSNQPNTNIVPPTPVFPNGHMLSMAHLLGPHPYLSSNASQVHQLPPNAQMMQYFGRIQPPAGLLHPALLHMAGLRNRRINTEKPPPIKKYKCDVCGKAFSRSNTLVTHKRIHTGDKPFKCEICGRAFRQPGNLTRHRLTHTTVKPYVCPSCNKAFNRASNLHTHMRTHTNFKPFTCPYCGKGFHQKIDMKIHCYTHTGERPHRCDICGKGFTLISTLNAHRRIHTENVQATEMA